MRLKILLLLAATALLLALGWATFFDPAARLPGLANGEPFFNGTSATGWSKKLTQGDEADRTKAAADLVAGGSAAVPILKHCLAATEPESRWRAAEALGKLGEPAIQAEAALIARLDDPDPLVADVAAQSLAQIGPAVAGTAVPALAKKFPRVECMRAVAKFGPAGAAARDDFVKLLGHGDPIVRWNAARALGKLKATDSAKDLVALLTDANPEVREHAAEALGDIGPAAAHTAPELVKVLKDPHPRVRRDAVRSFGNFGPAAKAHLAAVQALKNDPDADVKVAATRAERLIDPTLAK